MALRVVQHVPGVGQKIKPHAEECVARDVQDSEVGVALFPQQGRPQVSRVV